MTTNSEFYGGLAPAEDWPSAAAPVDVPNWTENLFWIAYDGASGMALTAHLGSLRHDFNVVRQTVVLHLPDGSVATDITVGGFRSGHSVRGATLTMDCIEGFRHWRMASNGVAQPAILDDLWSNTPRPAPRVPLQFDLQGEALSPVWNAGGGKDAEDMHQQKWAQFHIQQTIRLCGTVNFDGRRYEFNGTGFRDHSRGARDFATWHDHALITAPFPSGRSFGIMAVNNGQGAAPYRSAYVVRNGILERGVPRATPKLTDQFLKGESFTVDIEIDGRVESIRAKTRPAWVVSMVAPYDVLPGIYRGAGSFPLAHAMTTFEWDGEIGFGITERSAPADTLPPTR